MRIKDRSGIAVNLCCDKCGIIFQSLACQFNPNQIKIFCSLECTKKTDEEKIETRRECRKRWKDLNADHAKKLAREWRMGYREAKRIFKK